MIDEPEGYLHRWNAWRKQSVNREILSAAVAVGGMTAVVHLATAAKDVIIAYQFGTTDALDAYLIAFLVPSFAISIVAGSCASAFIPTYIHLLRREGHQAAEQLYQSVMTGTLIVLTGLASILMFAGPLIVPLLEAAFRPEKFALIQTLLLALLPVLVLKGLATVWAAVLNARERFFVAAGIPILTPAITVALLLVMGHQWGIYALVVGAVGGAFVEMAVLAWHLRRLKIPIVPHWYGWTPAIGEVTRQYGSLVAGAGLMGSSALVDQTMAATLGPGSVSALNYGGKVFSFTVVAGAMALGTAVLPHFSRMVADSDWSGLRHTVRTYIRWILFLTIPLTVSIVAFSEPLVRLVFQRGAFAATDTELVSRVQALLVLQLPFYVVGILIVRLMSSLKANSLLMWGAMINVSLNILLNYILMNWIGVAGIALATSIVTIVASGYLQLMIIYVLKSRQMNELSAYSPTDSRVQSSMGIGR